MDNRERNDGGITDELIDEIVKYVTTVSNIKDERILQIYTKAICTNILIKTNRRMFTPELKYVVMDLVIDKFNNNNSNDNSDLQSIQSMSEDGRSVNFGVSSEIVNKLNLLAQKQIQDNENMIGKFKLLYKT